MPPKILATAMLAAMTLWTSQLLAQPSFYLRGKVTDADSNKPLAAANIRVLGTARGTMTNALGYYSLRVDSGMQTIVISFLGYEPDSVTLQMTGDASHDAALRPSALQFPEVVVLAEDPAIDIIRKAIANKRKWMDKLKSYSFEAFTRQVLRRDTSVASITEAYTTGYMTVGDTLREIVKQKRQTENIPLEENLAAVRGIVNFNEDEIRLFSMRVQTTTSAYTFLGPTAPEALEYYDYKLLSTSTVSGIEVYRIAMKPKTRLRPLFEGTITIADGTFVVMGVDLKPNDVFTIPFTKDIDLRYRQEFALYDSIFWMPTNVRIAGGVSVSFVGFTMPRIGVEVASSLYDYAINVSIPDSVRQKGRLSVDSTAAVYDSTFWRENDVLPLTQEEQIAYRTLDSTQTLEKQFAPSGPLVTLGSEQAGFLLSYVDVRFNRVEGLFLGGKYKTDSLIPATELRAAAGVGFADQKAKYSFGATWFFDNKRTLGIGGDVYRKLDYVPDGGYYSPLFISLSSLIEKNDYRDYFSATGWRAFVGVRPVRNLKTDLGFVSEQHASVSENTSYSLFAGGTSYRPNPAIAEGNLRSIQLDIRWGPEPVPFDLVMQDVLQLSVEHTSPSIAKSDYDFTRFSGSVTWSVRTFARSLLFAPSLNVRVNTGTSIGTLPLQRLFVADSRASGYAPFGVLKGSRVKEFGGDRFVMINLEHNFRNVPFLALDIPFLYRNNIELLIHGSAAQTWIGSTSTSNGWYAEAGVGISRIFDLIRMDLTYRFKEPRRFYFTLSVANML